MAPEATRNMRSLRLLRMPLKTVKLTASFKLNSSVPEKLFTVYQEIVSELLSYAQAREITSFKRLKSEKYYELRAKYPTIPSHYVYTACQMACSIYKSFRKLKRRGIAKADKPIFKKPVIMLDDHLFSINLESWKASIATEQGRIELNLLHGTYHEKFKGMRVGEAWLVRKEDGCYLNVVFSKAVELLEPNGKAIAVDVNENNVAFGSANSINNIKTKERAIRTAYFLKRRRLQSQPRLNENLLMAKYKGRERRRIMDIYHKVANQIIQKARSEGASTIVLEKLTHIRKCKRSRELNGRLNRWSFRKLQSIIEYKAKIAGLNISFVKAKGTSSLCPRCRVKLSPSGYRLMRCPECGLEEDRDIIAVRNLLQKRDVPASSVHGESPPVGGKDEGRNESYAQTERFSPVVLRERLRAFGIPLYKYTEEEVKDEIETARGL